MTLTATWLNLDDPAYPSLWMASDSRISDGEGALLDLGVKLFEIPVIVRGFGESGFLDQELFLSSVGLLGTGHSLVFQNVIATLNTMLGNLASVDGGPPSLADLAQAVAEVTTLHVRQLGRRRHDAHLVTVTIGGRDLADLRLRAFRMDATTDPATGMLRFEPTELDLTSSRAHFTGNGVGDAERRELELLEQIHISADPPVARGRIPLVVLREFIADNQRPTVGGQVELGFTIGHRFTRVATFEPVVSGRPEAHLILNGAHVVENVGSCFVSVPSMSSGGPALPLDL